MRTKYQDTTRREEALEVLKTLARRIRSINADLVYVSLIESGFSEDETTRLTGALFRTAKARGWLTKTDFSIKSRRNNSNLQSIYKSNLFGKKPNGKPIPETEIKREYARWKDLGYVINDSLTIAWEVAMKYKDDCEVSFQQPPKDSSYGCTVMRE